MKSSIRICLFLWIITLITHTANSINCYSCESERLEDCGEDFDDEYIPTIDCDTQPVPRHLKHNQLDLGKRACKKVVYNNLLGEEHIERFCHFGSKNVTNIKESCEKEPSFPGSIIECAICDEELCNSSSKIVLNMFALFPLLGIYVLFKKCIL